MSFCEIHIRKSGNIGQITTPGSAGVAGDFGLGFKSVGYRTGEILADMNYAIRHFSTHDHGGNDSGGMDERVSSSYPSCVHTTSCVSLGPLAITD